MPCHHIGNVAPNRYWGAVPQLARTPAPPFCPPLSPSFPCFPPPPPARNLLLPSFTLFLILHITSSLFSPSSHQHLFFQYLPLLAGQTPSSPPVHTHFFDATTRYSLLWHSLTSGNFTLWCLALSISDNDQVYIYLNFHEKRSIENIIFFKISYKMPAYCCYFMFFFSSLKKKKN